jgi:hypothetical protein
MKADRVYELIVTRPPATRRLDPLRVEHVEVVDIASGEVMLFWDTLPRQTGRLARALRADLARLDAEEFIATWGRHEPS